MDNKLEIDDSNWKEDVFCKDCAYSSPAEAPPFDLFCKKVTIKIIDYVHGHAELRKPCHKARDVDNKCGPEGKLFKRKVSPIVKKMVKELQDKEVVNIEVKRWWKFW